MSLKSQFTTENYLEKSGCFEATAKWISDRKCYRDCCTVRNEWYIFGQKHVVFYEHFTMYTTVLRSPQRNYILWGIRRNYQMYTQSNQRTMKC